MDHVITDQRVTTHAPRLDRPADVFSRPALGRVIDTPQRLAAFAGAVLRQRGLVAEPNAAPLVARVNHGRWLADCPTGDGDAPVIDPEWGIAICLTCGSIFTTSIVLPAEWPAIDAALMQRPLAPNRNWTHAETLADLLADNAAHGL